MKQKEKVDLTLNYSFPDLYKFGLKWFEIIYACNTDNLLAFDPPLKILSVDGFTYEGMLKHHVNTLYEKDYDSFINSVQKRNKKLQARIIEELSFEIGFFKEMVVEEIPFDSKTYKRFKKWQFAESKSIYKLEHLDDDTNDRDLADPIPNTFLESLKKQRISTVNILPEIEITQEKILSLAGPFANAFIEAMDEFKGKLSYTKYELEKRDYKPRNRISITPGSFTYIIYEGDRALKDYKKYKEVHKLGDPDCQEYKNLKDLHNRLVHETTPPLISKKTHFKDFIKIFQGKQINVPIKWVANITQLHYFIKKLCQSKNIEDPKNKQYAIACKCFVKENGDLYSQDDLQRQKIPAQTSVIDDLINLF